MTNTAESKEASNVWMFPVEHYQELIKFIPNPVFIADKDNICLHINSAACNFLGYKRQEIIGKNIISFISDAKEFNLKILEEKNFNHTEAQFESKAALALVCSEL